MAQCERGAIEVACFFASDEGWAYTDERNQSSEGEGPSGLLTPSSRSYRGGTVAFFKRGGLRPTP